MVFERIKSIREKIIQVISGLSGKKKERIKYAFLFVFSLLLFFAVLPFPWRALFENEG